MLSSRCPVFLALLCTLAGNVFAGDFCGLADNVTEKAVEIFADSQDDALKLFIIARELCPNDAAGAYNLGVAYYRYGYLAEAQEAFVEAVLRDERNVGALNNLALLLLERQGDSEQALRYAERAVARNDSPATQETLARARFAVGLEVEALDELNKVMLENPEPRLKDAYDVLFNRYLADRVEKLKTGQP